jgi:hypothetical protein
MTPAPNLLPTFLLILVIIVFLFLILPKVLGFSMSKMKKISKFTAAFLATIIQVAVCAIVYLVDYIDGGYFQYNQYILHVVFWVLSMIILLTTNIDSK